MLEKELKSTDTPPKPVRVAIRASENVDPTGVYYDSGQGGWVRRVKDKYSIIEGMVRQSTRNPHK